MRPSGLKQHLQPSWISTCYCLLCVCVGVVCLFFIWFFICNCIYICNCILYLISVTVSCIIFMFLWYCLILSVSVSLFFFLTQKTNYLCGSWAASLGNSSPVKMSNRNSSLWKLAERLRLSLTDAEFTSSCEPQSDAVVAVALPVPVPVPVAVAVAVADVVASRWC